MNEIKNNNYTIIPYSIELLLKRNQNNQKKGIRRERRFYNLDYVIAVLSKDRQKRTRTEINNISIFLGDNYEYFKKIRDLGEPNKLEKLVSVLDLNEYKKNKVIIRFGELGDKFYVLLKGSVGVYKPIYIQKKMYVWDFYNLLLDIKNKDNDITKYNRIIEKNNSLGLDYEILINLPSEHRIMREKLDFIIEDEELMGIFNSGFAFGEIALIKKTTRNATIKANEKSFCVSLDKNDYNRIIGELEEKRLEKNLFKLQYNYPLLNSWSLNQLLSLFNYLSIRKLDKGDYLYKQNEDSNGIYFIEEGTFEIYSMVSFGWIQNFLSYIISAKNNLVNALYKKGRELKENEIIDLFDHLIKKKQISPCFSDPFKSMKITVSSKKVSLNEIKNKENEMNNPYTLYKILIRKIDCKDIIGIEDALELKQRFCFVKCISEHGFVKKVSLFDFFRLINLCVEENVKLSLMEIIAQKKAILYKRIVNFMQKKGQFLTQNLDLDYDKYLENKSLKDKIITLKFREKNPFDFNQYPSELDEKLKKINKKTDGNLNTFKKSFSNLKLNSIKKPTLTKLQKNITNNDIILDYNNNNSSLTLRTIKSKKFIKTNYNFGTLTSRSKVNISTSNDKFSFENSNLFHSSNGNESKGFLSSIITNKKKNKLLPSIPSLKDTNVLQNHFQRKKLIEIIKNPFKESFDKKLNKSEKKKKKNFLNFSGTVFNKQLFLNDNYKMIYKKETSIDKEKSDFYHHSG